MHYCNTKSFPMPTVASVVSSSSRIFIIWSCRQKFLFYLNLLTAEAAILHRNTACQHQEVEVKEKRLPRPNQEITCVNITILCIELITSKSKKRKNRSFSGVRRLNIKYQSIWKWKNRWYMKKKIYIALKKPLIQSHNFPNKFNEFFITIWSTWNNSIIPVIQLHSMIQFTKAAFCLAFFFTQFFLS